MNTYILQLVDPFEVTKGRHLFWGLLKFYRKLSSRSSHNTTNLRHAGTEYLACVVLSALAVCARASFTVRDS